MTGRQDQEFSEVREPTAGSLARQQQVLLRIGAICAIVGTPVYGASLAVHGDLPADESTAAALRYIVDHPNWLGVHLGIIVVGLLWIGAYAALAGTLNPGAAGALGRLLIPSAIVGGTFVVFDYAVDGYVLGVLADDWAAASGPERANLQLLADAALRVVIGTFHGEIVVFYGLTFLLAGLAVARDSRYPVWFGRIGAIAGGIVLVAGASLLAGASQLPDFLDVAVFLVIQPIEGLWLMALGVLMWRRAGRLRTAPGKAPAAVPRGA